MILDTWLVRRLAFELDQALRGARVQTVVSYALGLRLRCRRRGDDITLQASLDPDGPLVAITSLDRSADENGAGNWVGGVAPLLRGCIVESVHAIPNDRILYLDLSSRSAFGVPSQHRLAFEMEPLKANALVLRPSVGGEWHIIAAAKQIRSERGARDVLVGEPYVLPPARTARRDRAEFRAAVDADDIDARAIARLLGEFDPTCSTPLARETVERAIGADTAIPLSERLLGVWTNLRADVERGVGDVTAPVYAWRRGNVVTACHVVRLTWPPGEMSQSVSLNDVCTLQLIHAERRRRAPVAAALRKRLTTFLQRCEVESARLLGRQRAAIEADAYRRAGDSIYAYLADIPPRAAEFVTPDGFRVELDPALTAKENAAAYFKRLKKARSGLPRIAERLATLSANRAFWEQLLWELDRAEGASPDELRATCEEIGAALGIRTASRARAKTLRRPRVVPLVGGAVAHVGRSPKDNERVTFSVAAPHDLWFHARGIPGAHVVLKLENARDRATDGQILEAAALAAGQSRAAGASKVEVDYTPRKHVRKQGKGHPGLVWYTDFKTVLVAPRKLEM